MIIFFSFEIILDLKEVKKKQQNFYRNFPCTLQPIFPNNNMLHDYSILSKLENQL